LCLLSALIFILKFIPIALQSFPIINIWRKKTHGKQAVWFELFDCTSGTIEGTKVWFLCTRLTKGIWPISHYISSDVVASIGRGTLP
jgi:hypothetical protein